MKHKLIILDIFILLIVVYLGLKIFNVDIKLFFKKPICDHCNVILISLDTLGANHLPCYGYDRNTAQNLCNFAKDNVFFTNAFSNASWTLPSHFSIFTSLYPNHHNMVGDGVDKLDPNINTMAEFFKKANYDTIFIGPLDDINLPLDRGVERGFNTISSPGDVPELSGWDKGITQLIKNNNNKKSTFLFLHTYWVHSPYLVSGVSEGNSKRIYTNDFYPNISLDWQSFWKFSEEFRDFILKRYENKIKDDSPIDKKNDQNIIDGLKGAKNIAEAEKIYYQQITNWGIGYNNFSAFYFEQTGNLSGKVSYLKDLYDEMIYRLDKKLTMIFDLVKNPELANNTIIIITSDHGEEFMEHGSVSHPADHLYNTITSVPLIMYIPGIKQKKIDNLVQSIDILPIVLNLTGLGSSKNNFDGIDLTDSIFGRWNAKKNDYLISEGPNDSIRSGKWKLYVNDLKGDNANSYELYDLSKDPQEQNNIAENEPKIIKDLHDNLNRIIYKR